MEILCRRDVLDEFPSAGDGDELAAGADAEDGFSSLHGFVGEDDVVSGTEAAEVRRGVRCCIVEFWMVVPSADKDESVGQLDIVLDEVVVFNWGNEKRDAASVVDTFRIRMIDVEEFALRVGKIDAHVQGDDGFSAGCGHVFLC